MKGITHKKIKAISVVLLGTLFLSLNVFLMKLAYPNETKPITTQNEDLKILNSAGAIDFDEIHSEDFLTDLENSEDIQDLEIESFLDEDSASKDEIIAEELRKPLQDMEKPELESETAERDDEVIQGSAPRYQN